MAAGICKHIGARNVVVTDVNDYRLKLAADMGATRVVNVTNQSVKDVMADLHMEGFDVGLEMSGNPRAFNDMLDCMYNGGKVALLRSEEHTSELQSLMRISYAVFCLKKTKKYQ